MATLRASFGLTVRRLRVAAGLSQEKFAELAGVSRNFQGSVERGESSLSLDAAERFARTLGITLSRLLSEVEQEDASTKAKPGRKRAPRGS